MSTLLTMLQAVGNDGKGVHYAKRVFRDAGGALYGESPDWFPKVWRGIEVGCPDFDTFARTLSQGAEVGAVVIHGGILDGVDRKQMLRRQGDGGTIGERACGYLVLDIDQLALPDGMSAAKDPDAVLAFALDALPSEFHGARMWFHHSHSAGLKPLVKLHVAVLLKEPRTCSELQRWVKYQNEQAGYPLLDPNPYSPADFIGIGNPVIMSGAVDPIPAGRRYGIVPGERDTVSLVMPPAEWRPVGQRTNLAQQGDERTITGVGVVGVAGHLRRLGTECHGAIVDAVKAAFRERELAVDDDALEDRIIRAVGNAEWDETVHPLDYVETEVDSLPRTIRWARTRTQAAIEAAPHGVPAPRYNTPAEAVDALSKALDKFFKRCATWQDQCDEAALDDTDLPPAPLMAVKATTGVGKTRGVVNRLLDSPFKAVLYVAPTHGVLEEIRAALEAERGQRTGGKRWQIEHVYGRTYRDSKTGKPTMCQRVDAVAAVQKVGGNVTKVLCGTDAEPKCPYYNDCPFIEQQARLREAENDDSIRTVTLVATDVLKYRLPSGVRKPDLVIIDESFWQTLTSLHYNGYHAHLKGTAMRTVKWTALDNIQDDDGNVVEQVPNTVDSKELNARWGDFVSMIDTFWASGDKFFSTSLITWSVDELEWLRKNLARCRIDVDLELRNCGLDDRRTIDKIETGVLANINAKVSTYRALVKALIQEKQKTIALRTALVSAVPALRVFAGGDTIKEDACLMVRRAVDPDALGGPKRRLHTPTLFLDADLDGEIVRRWWPTLQDDKVADITCGWSSYVKIIHVRGNSFSKSWALGWKNSNDVEMRRVEKHQNELDSLIRYCMAINGANRADTMIVSYKDLIEALDKRSDDGLYNVPEDPEAWRSVGWFNGLAGIDRWRNVRVGFVIGRPQATPMDCSDLARAMWGHEDRDWLDVEPDGNSFLKMPRARYRLHTKEGVLPATVRAQRHPDVRGDIVNRQISFGQAMQADGRIRPVYRTDQSPCVLYVLGEVPRGMKVDAVVYWDDVVVDRFDVAVARAVAGGGVIPCSAGALSKFAPDLWKDAKAVEKDCRLQSDDDSVSIPVEEKLKSAIYRMNALSIANKSPLDAIGSILYHAGGTYDQSATATSPDGAFGEARNAGQKGSAFRWLRIPGRTETTLSNGLVSAFGSTVAKVCIEGGQWLAVDQLRDLEAQARRHRNVRLAWFKHGVVPPAPEDLPPKVLSPRAKFRKDVAERRAVRARMTDNDKVLYREAGAALVWSCGETLA